VDKIVNDDTCVGEIIKGARTIAVVGLSANPDRPSHDVAGYLKRAGFTIIPVNPSLTEVLGEKCYPSLRGVPVPIDIVDCFRRSEDIPAIVEEAIAVGAKCVWMQSGIVNEAAAKRARDAGLSVVMDRCLKVEHRRRA
jgi:uncharacterized protein